MQIICKASSIGIEIIKLLHNCAEIIEHVNKIENEIYISRFE